jgi:hypothetical protein
MRDQATQTRYFGLRHYTSRTAISRNLRHLGNNKRHSNLSAQRHISINLVARSGRSFPIALG